MSYSSMRILSFLGLLAFCSPLFSGELQVPPMFSDNMVLQRGVPVAIWGWADDGDTVTVKFRGKVASDVTENKSWHVKLPALKAGGPDTLVISTENKTLEFTNVLVGEVWVCSGQSNMEWKMANAFQPQDDIAAATNVQIRLLKVPRNRMSSPTVRIESSWENLSPESVKNFSAVGYYFGRSLQQALKVPVGLIGTYWGGTPVEAWTSRTALEISPRASREILEGGAAADKKWHEAMAAWESERDLAKANNVKFTKRAPGQPWLGAELFNGMIAPLLPYTMKGAIWYQGEHNAARADQYRELFPDMIRCWRRAWDSELTFLCVQLAPFKAIQAVPSESDWAELREAQLLATKALPKVGMAVITDVGDQNDIHPRKKAPVGERLAIAARALAYNEKIEFSGPAYHSMMLKEGKAILSFDHVGGGLVAKDGPLKGFAIAGEDRHFVWADARIEGDKVIVSSPEVPNPVAVRYGWANYPEVNLWNKAGLPASPFRTDDFPMVTAPRQ